MSKKKQAGKLRQHHQRAGKRLGLKISGGQKVSTGKILLRQKGTKITGGVNVGTGRDHTLFATQSGVVKFIKKNGKQIMNVLTQ